MKFAEKCPKCRSSVQTKSLRKSFGFGFVNIPVAQFCLNPLCDWYQDFAEAKKPEEIDENILHIKMPLFKNIKAEIKKLQPLIPMMIQKNMMVVKGAVVVIALSLVLIWILRSL